MLEITGEHIAKLGDEDLRALIGLLSEAELRVQNLPTKGVTWGGDQNAKDGGIDVRVDLSSDLKRDGFIPKSNTGFQVKKSDMPHSAILNEMCPDGELLESIVKLAEDGGAYIIVSSNGSTSDSALQNRHEAMLEATSELDIPPKLDFYDRNRVATWVRDHPSLILWVRMKIGNPIIGWQPYSNWANTLSTELDKYILDDKVRLYEEANIESEGMSALDGINTLRSSLSLQGDPIRLVGLSGVGKTRLVQALFEENIGEGALNKSQVFYTDVGDNPSPDPRSFAEQLLALKTRAILVVDNCPPKMHRRLTSVCSASGSLVSLITVEYDVKEDQPEETQVFSLKAASKDLIETLIRSRYNYINRVAVSSIAEFSGGNARIAIALASTVEKGESIAEIKDEELFERLFYQRDKNRTNAELLRSSEVCSLVYSFNIQIVESNELQILANLADRSVKELYADVIELQRRNLVQERNHWRAILPHAIANKLAIRALENIPLGIIRKAFEDADEERLLKSFSNRLGYLYKSEKAVEIAEDWLRVNGLLGDVASLSDFGMNLLRNIAPVKPEAILEAIERAVNSDNGERFTSRENRNFIQFTRLLRLLAYDTELFERATQLLCRFAVSENKKETHNSIRQILSSLFSIYLSGTHATVEQRLGVIKDLIDSTSKKYQTLGLSLLEAVLKTSYFTSSFGFNFGARNRDFGFRPTGKQAKEWYAEFIKFAKELIITEHKLSSEAKKILANKFRGLCINFGMWDELKEATEEIVAETTWAEGWTAIKTVLEDDEDDMSQELIDRLKSLESITKPTDLEQKVRLYVLSGAGSGHRLSNTIDSEIGENASDRYKKLNEVIRELGRCVVLDRDLFSSLLPEMVTSDGPNLFTFGQGMADGCSNPKVLWDAFRAELKLHSENQRKYKVCKGFLNSLNEINPESYEKILDEAIEDEIFGKVFPFLQNSSQIKKNGLDRLLNSLDLDFAPLHLYRNLRYGGNLSEYDGREYADLIEKIADKPGGLPIALEILSMKFHSVRTGNIENTDLLIQIGRDLLSKVSFEDKNRRSIDDYDLSLVIEGSLVGEEAKDEAKAICKGLADGIGNLTILEGSFPKTFEALATTHPIIFLNNFLGNDQEYLIPINFSSWSDEFNSNPLHKIDNKTAIEWCDQEPKERYPIMASTIVPFQKKEDSEEYEWTQLASMLVKNTSDKEMVLNCFLKSFKPMSWGGSRASVMETRLPLLRKLQTHANQSVADWADNAEVKYRKEVDSEYELEKERREEREGRASFE